MLGLIRKRCLRGSKLNCGSCQAWLGSCSQGSPVVVRTGSNGNQRVTSVCKLFPDSEWAVKNLPCVTFHVANFSRAQRVTLCQTGNLGDEQHLKASAPHCRELNIHTMVYSRIIALQWLKSCGNISLMELRNLSKNVWTPW